MPLHSEVLKPVLDQCGEQVRPLERKPVPTGIKNSQCGAWKPVQKVNGVEIAASGILKASDDQAWPIKDHLLFVFRETEFERGLHARFLPVIMTFHRGFQNSASLFNDVPALNHHEIVESPDFIIRQLGPDRRVGSTTLCSGLGWRDDGFPPCADDRG